MDNQLFLEDFSLIEKYDTLFESDHGEKKYYLRGIFSRVNTPNRNKRIYSQDVMEGAINSVKKDIENRGLVGSLDHPSTYKVSVKDISHVITDLRISPDGAVLGEAEALDTEPGQHLKKLMEAKIRLGVSTRGIGTVEPYSGPLGEGLVKVKSGYQMKAIDIVFDPSAESYPNYFQEDYEPKIYLGQTHTFKKVWEDVFGE
jgi:hypothetical protein